ncbi:hypothetical protein H7849_02710 [Alloacidobacterium dinghuense]|uniref:Lipoprotein n=1 Tax=Alloacidobacterium dinghuense TaxID=2763107 RepID=A0A7G8BK51_9BACT|nr:hypothetical protein [Alloacidobacterium dinghuense]QNI32921.1 hypothetical protein H7849_02710 [Alloacidobacterium dinghuense]
MRRSKDVPLTLLTALALSTTACDNRPVEVRNCVDAQGHIVPDSNCEQRTGHGSGGAHFLYGGSSGGRVGDTVVGGSAAPEAGAHVVSGEEAVARGGFGHAGGGEGGGE